MMTAFLCFGPRSSAPGRFNGPVGVTLRMLFVATAWAASLLALELHFYRLGVNWTHYFAQFSIALTHVTLALAWLAVFDVAGAAWKRIADRWPKK